MANQLVQRLRASVRCDAHNGDAHERYICSRQMIKAADEIERLERELIDAKQARNDEQRLRLGAERADPEPSGGPSDEPVPQAMVLLYEWLYADERFDLEQWTRRVRDFVEETSDAS